MVFPSPVVILSVVAVAMAAHRLRRHPGPAADRARGHPGRRGTRRRRRLPSRRCRRPSPSRTKPAIDKGKVYVEVYNNSGVTGLAGEVAASATQAGWKVVGSDNWYGTIPASSVYYPPKLARAARALALDLGIRRTVPAVDPMKLDRLTVILTADHA